MKIFQLFGRPQFLRAFHGWSVVFFIGLWAAATGFKWVESVVFISHVSMIALVLGSFSAWQAARVEVRQDEEIDSKD